MTPDPKRDTTGQLGRRGQEEHDTRERERQPAASSGEREARRRAADIDATYRSSNSDSAGVANSQAGTGGGSLPGPEDR